MMISRLRSPLFLLWPVITQIVRNMFPRVLLAQCFVPLPFLFYRVLVLLILFVPALFCRLFPFLILSLLIMFVLFRFPAPTLAQWWLVLMQSLVLSLPTTMMVLLCLFLAPPLLSPRAVRFQYRLAVWSLAPLF